MKPITNTNVMQYVTTQAEIASIPINSDNGIEVSSFVDSSDRKDVASTNREDIQSQDSKSSSSAEESERRWVESRLRSSSSFIII